MAKGTIRRLIADRGFGFIKTEDEKDLFFHRSVLEEVDYNSLTEGQRVEYEIGRGRDGRLQAVKVRLAEPVAEVMPAVELEEKPAEPVTEVSAEITPAAELEEKPAKPAARRRARAEPSPEPKVEKVEEAPPKPEGE